MHYFEDEVTQDKAVERQRRRWAIVGRPEIGKTTSLFTFPRPCAIVSCPDELGFGTIPKHRHAAANEPGTGHVPNPGLHPANGSVPSAGQSGPAGALVGGGICTPDCPRWQLDVYIFGAVNAGKPDWMGTCEETRRLMADLCTGKKAWQGKDRYRTVAVDGWHKLYPIYLNMFTGGQLAKGEQFDGRRVYPQTNAVFFGDGRRWCQTDVEWLVFTMWVDRDSDDPNNPNATSHFFPSLSGKAGQNVVGEIGITVAAERQGTGPAAKYIWLTQPDARYWGIGCHLPPELAKKLPPFVAQDWKALVPYLGLEIL